MAAHLQKVAFNLQGFASQSFLSDITLIVNEKQYAAHKAVLAAASDYFKSMFSCKMKENDQNEVTLKEISTAAFELCFQYIYSGEADFSEVQLAEVLFAASLFQLWDLQNMFFDFNEDKLSADNCFELYDLSLMYSNKKFQNAFIDFLRAGARDILLISSRYVKLKHEYFKIILEQEELEIPSDRVLYEAMIKWVKHDETNRQENFCSLLKLVRLPVIPEKYLSFTVSEHKHFSTCNICSDYLIKSFRYQLGNNRAGLTNQQVTWRGTCKIVPYGVANPLLVPDNRITAGSYHGNGWQPSNGRLNKPNSNTSNGGWLQSGNYSSEMWIQVDLKSPDTVVAGVITQGAAILRNQSNHYVKAYRVAYSKLGDSYSFIKDHCGKDKIFQGNGAENASVTNMFDEFINCRYLRIYPHSWNGDPVLRFDLMTTQFEE